MKMQAKRLLAALLEAQDPDDPQLNVAHFIRTTEREARERLNAVIDRAVAAFDWRVDSHGITRWEDADLIAARLGPELAEQAGYANGSDEFDFVVSAVNARASELFPGESFPEYLG